MRSPVFMLILPLMLQPDPGSIAPKENEESAAVNPTPAALASMSPVNIEGIEALRRLCTGRRLADQLRGFLRLVIEQRSHREIVEIQTTLAQF